MNQQFEGRTHSHLALRQFITRRRHARRTRTDFPAHPKQKESVSGRAQVWRGLEVGLCSLVS